MIGVNARVMYCRPGNLLKEFVVESNKQGVSSTGRVVNHHKGDGDKILKGCLANATDEDRKNHNVDNHIVTHTIVQAGHPLAKRGDKLVLGERAFYIVDIDDAGAFGITVIYYAEERNDAK